MLKAFLQGSTSACRYRQAMVVSRSQRIQVCCHADFTQEEGVSGEGVLFNLSMGGAAVRSSLQVSDGMLVSLRIRIRENQPPVQVEMARVRWATTSEFGVEFLMVVGKERHVLERFIRDHGMLHAA